MARPALILAGYGSGHPLQITVESQRALAQASRVFSLGLPVALAKYLQGQRIKAVDLGGCFEDGRPFAEAYLDVADTVLAYATDDPTVAFLTEGNPLLSNALNRFLVTKAKERELATQILPAVSPIDALICQVGLDVGTFGLQVFDARRLVTRQLPIHASVPLLLVQAGSLAHGETTAALLPTAEACAPLVEYLGRFYPPEHVIVHLANSTEPAAGAMHAVPLSGFESLVPRLGPASTLFVDRVRPASR